MEDSRLLRHLGGVQELIASDATYTTNPDPFIWECLASIIGGGITPAELASDVAHRAHCLRAFTHKRVLNATERLPWPSAVGAMLSSSLRDLLEEAAAHDQVFNFIQIGFNFIALVLASESLTISSGARCLLNIVMVVVPSSIRTALCHVRSDV